MTQPPATEAAPRRADAPAPHPAPALEAALELAPGRPPVLHVDAPVAAPALADWAAEHGPALESVLLRHGAVLVRGLGVRDAAALGRLAEPFTGPTVPEREAFARRRPLGGPVFSSLEWPPDQPMCMHHELSYALEFPRLLAIGCFTPPATGGVTGLADARQILADLPAEITERFTREGWELTRSYNSVVGVGWQEAFGTEDRAEAEAYCEANGIAYEWQPDGSLRTRQRRSAVIGHPLTGDRVWFNQIAFLSEWTMEPAIRDYLVRQLGPEGLAFNTRHGDGTPLAPETVATVNEVYEAATLREPWQAGDVLLVDNIRMAHSREPFTGPREVGMVLGAPVRLADCPPAHS
ncbi:TauD/TfdA family dioxygenase [Streptomyces sp. NPDC059788]|uniref:TauD/TfdA family dioxygenase n=1 Tax=Streptomyces sp. NPDC059788 TaxID=3346948 RepID=UPI00366778FD